MPEKALKVLVVVMGIMIIAGVGVIVVTIINRATAPETKPSQNSAPVPGEKFVTDAQPGQAFGDISVAIPAGMQVLTSQLSQGHVMISIGTPERIDHILLYSVQDGRQVGRFKME